VQDKTGKIIGVLGSGEDITERKRAEEALEENERRFRATFEQAAVGVAHVAPDGRFIRINQRFCDITGRTKEEMLECTFQDITHPDDLALDLDYVNQMLAGKISNYSMEKRYLRKDGSPVWIDLTVSLLREDSGEPKFFISVIEDITERKKARDKLVEYQEQLRSLASELSLAEERERRRIATALHDSTGQELVSTLLKLQHARETASGDNLELLDDACEMMRATVDDVRNMTFDICSPTLYRFGLEAAISELLEDRFKALDRVNYSFRDDNSAKPLAEDIRIAMFQSVRELINNVLKHAGASEVSVTIQRCEEIVRITVSDDGVGFRAEELEAPSRSRGGFGLFGIAERLRYIGGNFEFQSQPGCGSSFTLEGPLEIGANLH
jgi:two-component system sensor histidine kinase UhpB